MGRNARNDYLYDSLAGC